MLRRRNVLLVRSVMTSSSCVANPTDRFFVQPSFPTFTDDDVCSPPPPSLNLVRRLNLVACRLSRPGTRPASPVTAARRTVRLRLRVVSRRDGWNVRENDVITTERRRMDRGRRKDRCCRVVSIEQNPRTAYWDVAARRPPAADDGDGRFKRHRISIVSRCVCVCVCVYCCIISYWFKPGCRGLGQGRTRTRQYNEYLALRYYTPPGDRGYYNISLVPALWGIELLLSLSSSL